MTVIPLSEHRSPDALAAAIARHPSSIAQQRIPLPTVDPAHGIETLCRRWDETADSFSAGPDCLSRDEAEELLQHLVASLCHRDYTHDQLALMLPQIRAAVAQHDGIRDGDITAFEVGESSYGAALARARAELDWLIAPLVHNWPSADACSTCVRIRPVSRWQLRGDCDDHDPIRAI